MSIQVHVTTRGPDTIIALDGAADADLLTHLGDGVAAVARSVTGRVLVDIGHLTLLDDTGLGALVDQLIAIAGERSGLIAPRFGMRRVLSHWGVTHRIPVYDALPPWRESR